MVSSVFVKLGIDRRGPPGIDPRMLEVLNQASNLQLFQLSAVIERMLADPRRILQEIGRASCRERVSLNV